MSVVATWLSMAQNAGRPVRKHRPACDYSTGAVGRWEWDRLNAPIFSTSWAETQEDMLMADYTIVNIPTLYRGRMYRSRLEARWAAFFDRLGWTHEYEPFDLGTWSPDFAITEPFDALVEVKPLTEPDYDLFERVQTAADKQGFVFVTRVAPIQDGDSNFLKVGWWAASYSDVAIVWQQNHKQPSFHADFLSFTSDLKTWVTCTNGTGAMNKPPHVSTYREYTERLWADACNAVQWEPRQ